MNVKQCEKLGADVIAVLGLKKNKQGRYNTAWGDKTVQGIGATVSRLYNEALATENKTPESDGQK